MDVFPIEWFLVNGEYVGLALLALWVAWGLIPEEKPSETILRRFGLSSKSWQLLGHDLGGKAKPLHVRGWGLCGTPDLVARRTGQKRLRVFDYKHRKSRGYIRDYERYQVMLYRACLLKMYPGHEVEMAIRFKDKVVDIKACDKTLGYVLSCREDLHRYLYGYAAKFSA